MRPRGKSLRLFSTINSKYNLPVRRKDRQKQVYHTYHIWLHSCCFQQGFGLHDYSDTLLSLWVTAKRWHPPIKNVQLHLFNRVTKLQKWLSARLFGEWCPKFRDKQRHRNNLRVAWLQEQRVRWQITQVPLCQNSYSSK